MRHWPDRLLQATAVLLVASVALIAPSLAGLGTSLPLALVLAVVAGGLFAVRDRLASAGPVARIQVGGYLHVAWLGPLVGAAVVLVAPGASPGELQALGGLCGLLGMVNYFLRPIYALVIGAVRAVDRRIGGPRGS